ncbi:hypothetical protein DY000_02056282 [Brassica cretica]|uniref:Uncharacterized protein n=1 Tax=Brassica cretica TaxID=69181 RepID=A0ABQ7AB74_BRACR|nr:hypothetical protein DY000_02056282 [Brassica cretica]
MLIRRSSCLPLSYLLSVIYSPALIRYIPAGVLRPKRGLGDSFLGGGPSMAMTKETAAVEDGWVVCFAGGHFVALRSYSPAPRRRGADYSASPRRRHEEHPRSPPRGHPRGEEDGKYSRRSYSPGYEGGSAAEPEKNGEDEIRERKASWGGRSVSRSPSGSRSRSVEASPR